MEGRINFSNPKQSKTVTMPEPRDRVHVDVERRSSSQGLVQPGSLESVCACFVQCERRIEISVERQSSSDSLEQKYGLRECFL